MHRIAGEERHPASPLWTTALRLQAAIDWSNWVRRVDVALIGGDPILLARRVSTLLREHEGATPLRIAILHPGAFSGAPLAALEDPVLRAAMGLEAGAGVPDEEAPLDIMRREIDRAAGLLNARSGGGVLAFEMVQGLKDRERGEVVLRLTRPRGRSRRRGLKPTDAVRDQIAMAHQDGRASDLYQRSEALFRRGLAELHARFAETLTEPPRGRRFVDLVIARRCELLSGFISPPTGSETSLGGGEIAAMVGVPYHLAGPPPLRVAQAVGFWARDFGRAANVPISSAAKELDT